ncbi:dynamin family protein [Streptomyces sp. NRRL S-118]|uniref:dynamin family protein n=1 Tax=Streptomyces sp. NRRL S-118 TaxID=1463881 RepID=UPI0004C71223|nr:dynamin family protein [Streptomyces sp. NRRL S-118]
MVTTDQQARRLLAAAIGEAHRNGRPDLAARLAAEAQQLSSGPFQVLVAGEFKKGKSSLVNGLVGVPVCGTDPTGFTTVPILVGHATTPRAALITSVEGEATTPADPREVAAFSTQGADGAGRKLAAIEVGLPRTLLSTGLVLVDSPGLGGGFSSAQAAAAMRAVSLADAVLVVSDASQEYTAAEIDFLRHVIRTCPNTLCVLTKTDLYLDWRRILEINRRHVATAGLSVEIVPVSARLRELALDAQDAGLNAESGFPVLIDRLRSRLAGSRASASGRAAAAVTDTIGQIARTLSAAGQPEDRLRTEQARRRAAQLGAPTARWMNMVNDRFADIGSRARNELQDRMLRLEQEAVARVNTLDPITQWDAFVPWLYQRTNEELTDCHHRTLAAIDEVAAEVAKAFSDESGEVLRGAGGAGPAGVGESVRLGTPTTKAAGRMEVGMQAARGWSLSSSVVTTLLITTLHPALWVLLPVTAVFGTVFAVKSVRDQKAARVEQSRREGATAVATYLRQQHACAGNAAADLIRRCQTRLRDYYLDRAAELRETAERSVLAAASGSPATTAEGLDRVRTLLESAQTVAARSGYVGRQRA